MAMRSFLVRHPGLVVFLVACAIANRAASAAIPGKPRPEAVSPGELDRMVGMGEGCFTFSWAAVEGALGFELAVHLIDSGAADKARAPAPALQARVPATLSWTPSLEKCLPPGRYAWVVRANTVAGWTEWSEPRLFEVRGVAPDGPRHVVPEAERPASAISLDGLSPAIMERQTTAGEHLFTPAPQHPRRLTGAAYSPPTCSGVVFSDVSGGNPYCAWIEQLAADKIAAECEPGSPRRFCPDQPVTRGQLAMLLERTMHGTDTWRPEQGDGAAANLPPAPVDLHTLQT